MKLLLVGGFLGSGKTTAIQRAAAYLRRNDKKAGVITNDQGVLQVDTEFMKGQEIPTEEVVEGCFCCHFDDLEDRIETLLGNERPDIIFAEPVGSCVDLAATVVNPLLSLNRGRFSIVLSVFADSVLLIKFLQGSKSIFYDNVNYIYENQLREADIIVVNKIDLLTASQLEWVRHRVRDEYGGKTILFQNSLSDESVSRWLSACDNYHDDRLRTSLVIDYDIYGAGEAELAWLDEEIGIVSSTGNAIPAAYELMRKLHETIMENGHAIGHLKFLLDDGEEQTKVSFTTLSAPQDTGSTGERADRVVIILNARIQVSPAILQQLVSQAILAVEARMNCRITEYRINLFQPGYPRPTHRILQS
ncbi:MAG TPA: GTP-binding protein [Puia sp.]|jgi:Ni2+-binding GTPase involved in maturation of urease and hydrogenase|nr:GTP-binding protein [Puia sp.]